MQLARNSMYGLMKEALTLMAYNGITDKAVVLVDLHCTGLDTDFVFNPGGETKHMHHFLWSDPVALQKSFLDKLADIIQSEKECAKGDNLEELMNSSHCCLYSEFGSFLYGSCCGGGFRACYRRG